MNDRKPPKYAKKPPPLNEQHDCTKMAVMVEKVKWKNSKPIVVFQCPSCGKVWEEEP